MAKLESAGTGGISALCKGFHKAEFRAVTIVSNSAEAEVQSVRRQQQLLNYSL
jgi:hypothetical protein